MKCEHCGHEDDIPGDEFSFNCAASALRAAFYQVKRAVEELSALPSGKHAEDVLREELPNEVECLMSNCRALSAELYDAGGYQSPWDES